jgi:uncharacterized membrane protein
MSGEIPSFAKYVFLLGFIASIIFGVWTFLSPESFSAILGWPDEPTATRLTGSYLIVLAIAALLAYRASSWKDVELYVLIVIMWMVLGTISLVWSTLVEPLTIIGWALAGLLMLFFVLYLYVYMQGRAS